jgi:hypothetical protein
MTVKELIDKLSEASNKDIPVKIYNPLLSTDEPHFSDLDTDEMWENLNDYVIFI